VLENLHDLQVAVKKEKAELGIAFDGDGDRIGAVDEKGEPVLGDQLLCCSGATCAAHGQEPSVIFDVKCSEVLPQMLQKAGLEPVIWKTGIRFIKPKKTCGRSFRRRAERHLLHLLLDERMPRLPYDGLETGLLQHLRQHLRAFHIENHRMVLAHALHQVAPEQHQQLITSTGSPFSSTRPMRSPSPSKAIPSSAFSFLTATCRS